MRVLLEATTSAATSAQFAVTTAEQNIQWDEQRLRPAHVVAFGLQSEESCTMQIRSASGTWHDYQVNSSTVTLTATNMAVVLEGPGRYLVEKPTTAGAVSIELGTDTDILPNV